MNLLALTAPFPPEFISWRVGSTTGDKAKGMALAYIDARDVMNRLDAVCGPSGWQCRYQMNGPKVACDIGLKIDGEWVWKSNGAGETDIEGDKGSFSDALKRAAVMWGVGRYLYGLDSPWVEIEPSGKSFRIKESEYKKLNDVLAKQAWRGPLGKQALKDATRDFVKKLMQMGNITDFAALVTQNQKMLDQLAVDIPEWFYGNDDTDGAFQKIEQRQHELCKGMAA